MARDVQEYFGIRRIEKTLTIRKDAMTLYREWRRLSRMPLYMSRVISVIEMGARSHWVVKTAAGNVSWNAVITDDIPGRLVAWRSLDNQPLANAGEAWFHRAAQGRATEMRVVLAWETSQDGHPALLSTMCGEDAAQTLEADLHRFKRLMETGSVPTTWGQPHGGVLQRSSRESLRNDGRIVTTLPHVSGGGEATL